MTKIVVSINDKSCLLVAQGHAEGSDAVCAGISAIIYSLVGTLHNTSCKTVREDVGSGDVSLEHITNAQVKDHYKMAGIGLAQIAESYPEYCVVKFAEEK